MREETLMRICLIVALVGIVIMFSGNKITEPKIVMISDVTESENYVKLKGFVDRLQISSSGTTFIKLKDESGDIDVVIFKDSIENVNEIKTGDLIEVLGKVQKYKGKLEVIASRITSNQI